MKKIKLMLFLFLILIVSLIISSVSYAQPYGKGVYNSNVPYGSQTSLSINTNGQININNITPTDSGTLATTGASPSVVTVTSTDVMGYKLYIRALNSTSMDNLGTPLPASANTYPSSSPLTINTWGYNTDGSDVNFAGITLSPNDVLIRSVSTPVKDGSATNVYYGLKIDTAKPAGNYVANVVYTAVPQTN